MTLYFRVTTKILIIVYHGFSLLDEFKKHYGTFETLIITLRIFIHLWEI